MKCKKCKLNKSEDSFYKVKTNLSGRSGKCIDCTKKDTSSTFQTKKGLVARIYNTQLAVSKRRNHQFPAYTSRELYEWCMSTVEFHQLFNNWKSAGYLEKLKPSIDRLDDYDGYHFGNIQIVTWGYNNNKGYADTKSGKNSKKSKTIYKFDLDGNIIDSYLSIAIACRENNMSKSQTSHITAMAKHGNGNHVGGFIWRYTDNALEI